MFREKKGKGKTKIKKLSKQKKRPPKRAPKSIKRKTEKKKQPGTPALVRAVENRIILPKPEHHWAAWQTFNPGVILLEDKIHFRSRAIRRGRTPRFRYSVSSDGVAIDER